MSSDVNAAYLSLIKLGIGHKADVPNVIDWNAVRLLASIQGLAAVVLDGVKALMDMSADSGSEDGRRASSALEGLGLDFKFDWMGESVVMYEQRYEQYKKVIGRLAKFYNSHGFNMMVLKGYGLSLNYPVSNHRPCGDIDIWQFGSYKEADAALSKERGIKIDNEHHHHTVFHVDGFMVENHYDIVNVHYGHKNKEIDGILKRMLTEEVQCIEVLGEEVYLPPATFNAFFLIRHSMQHFAAVGISIRHILDWAFFVEKLGTSIDWKLLLKVLTQFKMLEFFNCTNAICVEDLGFDADIFPSEVRDMMEDVEKRLKNRVLTDIISPEFSEEIPQGAGFFKRIAYKYRRWQANAWKQKLCYSDNRFIAFWQSVWDHLLKPSSI